MELPCALGKTITNEVFMFDLAKAPHLLVAGATGQGKSVGLNAIVTSLLYKKHPAELKIVLVDPKKVEFSIYNPLINHFLAKVPDEDADPIITDVTKVVRTLNSLCKLMDTRYDLLKEVGARNIKEYNKKFIERKIPPRGGHGYMPYIVVIIDEFGDLIMTAGKEIELPIARIAQLARAVGIHMVIATQRPTTTIITGNIKANFPARIAFKVSAGIDSKTILDRTGAQQLIGRGDMLFLNGAEPVRVQCAFVDTPEVERINEFIADQQSYGEPFELPEPDMPESDMGDGGSSIVLHHRFGNHHPLTDALAADDERVLHFQQRLAAMVFLLAAVVGGDDDDGVVVDSRLLQCLHQSPHQDIQLSQSLVVLGSVVTDGMARMIQLIPTDGKERGFAVEDVLLCHAAQLLVVVLPTRCHLVVIDGQGINDMLDAIPLGNTSSDYIRTCLAQQREYAGEDGVFVQFGRRYLRGL